VTTEFGILGPLQAVRDGEPVPLGGPRQRAVLARLLLDLRRVVAVDVLADDVWDGAPPGTATKTLQKYVWGLRQGLGPGLLRTSGGGYTLDAEDDALDARRFERLLGAGEAATALALWRGAALADLPDLAFVAAERSRLEELRVVAVERSLEADLRAGRHDAVVPRLAELSERHPLRERLCGLLMLGLYRSGRQVEALQAFQRHRRRLAEELGVDPAADLVALESAILRHDPGLDLPSARSTGAPPGNLRPPVSSFVGRDAELRRIAGALREHRLVTLIGPGGVGKTRLAVEVGALVRQEQPGGVWLVDLAAVTDPGLVGEQLAGALSIGEQPGQDIEDTVVAALQHHEGLLLLLDNCEHLFERCARLADRIARTCPAVRTLATSRRPLGVDGECVLPVAPLSDHDACRLFADRAGLAGTPRDEVVGPHLAPICRSLDGLPLALELAAGQLRVLGPDELAARLDQRLRFPSGRFDSPPRQRTLRDMVGWSAGLLPAATQRFFARLGVFATTLTLDAATAVCGDDDVLPHVSTLVDHSLLVREPGPPPAVRYRLLDTLRLFALERLRESGEEEAARRAHARFYLRVLEEAGPRLLGPDERAWARRIEAEEPNLHAALAWATERDHTLALRLGVALWPYWEVRWRERSALAHFTTVLAAAGEDVPDDLRAWALTAMAALGANPGEARLATVRAGRAAALFRRLGDVRGLAHALVALGSAQGNEGALDAADRALDEALVLARRLGEGTLVAQALNFRSFVATRRGDLRLADELGRAELAAWIALGSRRGEATALRHVANTARYLGDLDEATRLCERALALWREMGDSAAVAHVQNTLADVARLRGDLDGALRLHEQALEELRRIGDRRCTASTAKNRAAIAAARGDHRASATLLLEAVRLRVELGDYAGLAECFDALAADLAATGQHNDAVVLLAAAEQRRAASGSVASPEEAAVRGRAEEAVGGSLPATRRAELRRRGLRLGQDEAVAFALTVGSAGRPAGDPVRTPAAD
jgi:predicted ATPase/DNA-binding SARP family transcriptional activator